MTVNLYGHKIWQNVRGIYHRLDGPAIEWANGVKAWHVNGLFYCSTDQSTKDFILGMLAWCEVVEKELNK